MSTSTAAIASSSTTNLDQRDFHENNTIHHSYSESDIGVPPADEDIPDAIEELSTELNNRLSIQSSSPLTDAQVEILNKFKANYEKQRSQLTPLQSYYIFDDSSCFVRYLKARDWDITNATKLLNSSLHWLESYKPYALTARQLYLEASPAKIYIKGKDKVGRPIIYLHAARDATKDPAMGLYLLIYTLIAASYRMENGVQQMTWVCDFKGYSTKSAPPLSVCKQAIEVLSSHFPERLGICIMVNAPKVFHWFFKLISPLIPPVTKSKIQFCKSEKPQEMRKFFENFIDPSQFDTTYGGDQAFEYKHVDMWAEEMKWDQRRLEILRDANAMTAEDVKTLLEEPICDNKERHALVSKHKKATMKL